jgi:hypothetical protein
MSDNLAFTEVDDNFHLYSDDPFETETCWFCFNVPERRMGGWLWGAARANLGLSMHSIFVWDDTASAPWELPYFSTQFSQPLPRERDLRDFTFTEGFSVRMIEPLMRYHVGYQDRKLLSVDLTFEGVSAPHRFASGKPPFGASPHLDQAGRMFGEIVLRGEKIPVDCYTIRDRSWGPRLDHKGGRIGYDFCTASAGEAFMVFARPQDFDEAGAEIVNHGYVVRNGVRTNIAEGRRRVRRDPKNGWVEEISIRCTDEHGSPVEVHGTALSRMVIPRARGITVNTLLHWRFDGVQGWGEDQDAWRYDQWSAARREGFPSSWSTR